MEYQVVIEGDFGFDIMDSPAIAAILFKASPSGVGCHMLPDFIRKVAVLIKDSLGTV